MVMIKSNTTVSIPADLKEQAILQGISFSEILIEALREALDKETLEDLGREGGKPEPVHQDTTRAKTEANPC